MPAASPFLDFIAQYGIWIFGLNLGLSFIGAATAKRRGYSYGGFLCLGIFTSFLIGLIVAACLKPKEGSLIYNMRNAQYIPPIQNSLSCSACGRFSTPDMVFCPNCGYKINESSSEEPVNNTVAESSESKTDW